mmetsp:Transcript_11936/g.20150  ORF Transcript_11936/g.20150 Transcript_11936/m.20150 type:complete len:317 (-) Transcript_11936:159-1109(-)
MDLPVVRRVPSVAVAVARVLVLLLLVVVVALLVVHPLALPAQRPHTLQPRPHRFEHHDLFLELVKDDARGGVVDAAGEALVNGLGLLHLVQQRVRVLDHLRVVDRLRCLPWLQWLRVGPVAHAEGVHLFEVPRARPQRLLHPRPLLGRRVVRHLQDVGGQVRVALLVHAHRRGHHHRDVEHLPLPQRAEHDGVQAAHAQDARVEVAHAHHHTVLHQHVRRLKALHLLAELRHDGDERGALLVVRSRQLHRRVEHIHVQADIIDRPARDMPRDEVARLPPPELGCRTLRPRRHLHRVQHEPIPPSALPQRQRRPVGV